MRIRQTTQQSWVGRVGGCVHLVGCSEADRRLHVSVAVRSPTGFSKQPSVAGFLENPFRILVGVSECLVSDAELGPLRPMICGGFSRLDHVAR